MVRIFVLLFSFSIFSDRRSLKAVTKIENDNNSIKNKCRNLNREVSYMDDRAQERVWQGKQAIMARAMYVLL